MQIRGRYVNRKETEIDGELLRTWDSAWFLQSSLLLHQLPLQRKFERKEKRREGKGEQRINNNEEKDENGKIGGSK